MESKETDTAVAGSRARGRAGVQVGSGQKALFSALLPVDKPLLGPPGE